MTARLVARSPSSGLLGVALALCLVLSASPWLAMRAEAAPVNAVVLDPKDVRRSVLVGPSGQLYEPTTAPATAPPAPATTPAPTATPPAPSPSSSSPPRWARRTAGGVSSSVASAADLEGDVYAAGTQTPLFRRAKGQPQWMVIRLGQRGRVVFGSGPFFSLSIGRQIFVRVQGRFVRIGTAPAPVVALWAASETAVAFATDQGVFRRRGKAFVQTTKLPGVLGFSGAAPHALTVDTAINLRTGARVRLPGQTLRVARSESTPAAIVRSPAGTLMLARDLTSPATHIALTGEEPPAFAAVDAAGRALVSAPDSVLVYDGTTWQTATLTDELPTARPGPPAARSR